MARYRYSPAPSTHGPDEIDVSTIRVPARWLADWPASGEASGRLVLTDSALGRLVDGLAGGRVAGPPKYLSPYGMVALLDAAWDREQPWRDLVEVRLRERRQTHRGFQQHLYQLQDRWNHLWAGRYGLYTEWLTDGLVTEEMFDRWEAWMDEHADRHLLIEANHPGGLGVEQTAQLTHAAIQGLAGDPGDRFLDEVIDEVFEQVKAELAAVPARPGVSEPEALLASVVVDVVEEYLVARLDWGWPPGRANAWAYAEVIDRHTTLSMTAVARGEGDTAFAAQTEDRLEERTKAARRAWADQATEPWLRTDVGSLLAAMPADSIPASLLENARAARNAELLDHVDAARVPSERPLGLEVAVAVDTADRARSHLDEEGFVLHGLRGQLHQTGPWWRPGTWTQRANLKARITERQRLVSDLGEQLHQAEEKLAELLPASRAAVHAWQAQRRFLLGPAVAAVQELQCREQGLLDDLVADPPDDLVETLGPPSSDEAGRQAWQAQALQLERARAAGVTIDGVAARTAASVAPPTFSGRQEDRAAASAWIVARDQAGWPVDPAVRDYALGDGPPVDLRPAKAALRLDGMAQPPLEQDGPPAGSLRLYRAQRIGKAADLSEWIQANQGGWFTSDPQAALGDAKGGRLLAVDVRKAIADGLKVHAQEHAVAGKLGEYLVPENLASMAREIGLGAPTGPGRVGPEPPVRDL